MQIPWGDYEATVQRIREAGFETREPHPTWRQDSYWGWTVRDPAGNTVEVFGTLRELPAGAVELWNLPAEQAKPLKDAIV